MATGKFERLKQKRKIAKLSWGLAFTMTDLMLVSLFLGLAVTFPTKAGGQMLKQIFKSIKKNFREEKIRRAVYELKKDGLLDYATRLWLNPLITREGKRRLEKMLPRYNEWRLWDKRLYLITYDIPETERGKRDRIRIFLKKIGCGLLQKSVWVTPYNPKEVIKKFVSEAGLTDLILVSDLGKDGQIGQENMRDLTARIYQLENLNRRYFDFIDEVNKKQLSQAVLAAYFFSILKDDPQLPFELLPDDWLGEKAWTVIKPLLKNDVLP